MKAFFPCWEGSNLILGIGKKTKYLSTKWVDYVVEPMKYQVLRPHFFSMDGWLEGWWWGEWCGGLVCVWLGGVGGCMGGGGVGGGWSWW